MDAGAGEQFISPGQRRCYGAEPDGHDRLSHVGKSLTYKSFPYSTSLEVPVIMPGQRVDFGDELIP